MITSDRRNFIKKTAGFAAGTAIVTSFPLACQSRRKSPNEIINIALIGVRGRGWSALMSHLKVPNVECIALCDVDSNVMNERAAEFEKLNGKKPDLYSDFRKLLERKDLDAVIIATPDHWHTLPAIYAMQADKDVYVEKPLANSIEECLLLEKASKRYKSVVQVGQQQRSGQHWNDAADYIRSGALGRISNVKAFLNYGHSRELTKMPDSDPPQGVDYDFWLGPARKKPFNPRRFHGSWRHFWDYGGGNMTDWGVHLIDMVLMFMDVGAPNSVVSSGGKFTFPNSAAETPDNQVAVYEFDNFVMTWEHTMGIGYWPYDKHHGVVLYGENGMLIIDRGGWEVRPNSDYDRDTKTSTDRIEAVPHQPNKSASGDLHAKNFIDCVRSREKPVCDLSIGVNVAINAHLGNIAYRLGKKVQWDRQNNVFINDPESEALSKAHYRDPWSLPKI
jgi:predicted dehydrogenase